MSGFDFFRRKGQVRLVASIAAFLLFMLLLSGFLTRLSADTAARQKQALADAIRRDLNFCYITEGRYPEDLQYLQTRYGLTYDENRFFVDYQSRGGNLLPDVTILERRG